MKLPRFNSRRISAAFLWVALCIPIGLQAQENDSLVWPKDIVRGEYTITLYRPDNASYIDNRLKSNLAFAVKKEGEEPQFGMLWTNSLIDVDRGNRQATLVSTKIEEVRLADDVSEENKAKLEDLINEEIPNWGIEFPLDHLLEDLEEVSVYSDEYKNEPPNIVFATKPTALVTIDGEPKFRAAESGFELVENTGAFLLRDTKKNTLYLKGGDFWYQASAVLGPWKQVDKVPSKVSGIAKKAGQKSQGGDASDEDAYTGSAPEILVVTTPTELVVLEGEAKYAPIQNTNLLFVENSESNLFMNVASQQYYVLLSGRWFTSKNVEGPWTFQAPEQLPEDFKNIPEDSKKADVLANVPGTKQARNAVYDAQIPQTAAVNRDTKASEVVYNGTPEFKAISGLQLQYAVNTESAVFKDKNTYYLCDNAIWFTASNPNGPWVVADQRPEEVSKIPADNPKYNTKYVYIYETSPSVVYVGYTPGYYGCYVYGPTVIYGTGYYYNPWYGGHYYHHHYTYGFSVRYNPWYGWSFGFHFGSPYGWYGHAYWGFGYHHWGPPYYRPPYYRPGYRPRPSHPIYRNRRGVAHYNRPATRPSRPAARPAQRPATRPAARPAQRPSTQPAQRPSARPAQRPSTQPAQRPADRPATRPSNMPSTRPSYRSPSINTRPYSRPSQPVSRPSARPASRPVARPSGMSGARRSGGRF